MIKLYFDYFGEKIYIEIIGKSVYFSNSQYGTAKGTIDSLKLNYNGTIKEFPDLKNNINWQKIARDRFKEKIKSFESEDEIEKYLISDLKKVGYVPLLKQKKGYRTEVIK